MYVKVETEYQKDDFTQEDIRETNCKPRKYISLPGSKIEKYKFPVYNFLHTIDRFKRIAVLLIVGANFNLCST